MSSSEERVGGVEPETVTCYLTWICEGCDACAPLDGSDRDEFPCTHDSPSVNGAWVVKAADHASALRSVEEELRQAREAEKASYDSMIGWHNNCRRAEADRDRLAAALRSLLASVQSAPLRTAGTSQFYDSQVGKLTVERATAALSPVQGEHEQGGEDAGGPSLDEVYAERNKVVLAFAALVKEQGWDVGLTVDPDSPDWPVLMIETDAGQVSWHFQAGELPSGLPLFAGKWDGHSTPEKYARLAELVRSGFGLSGEIAQDGDTEETT